MKLIFPADKHQRFLQIDTIILAVCYQPCPNNTEKNRFAISLLQYERSE